MTVSRDRFEQGLSYAEYRAQMSRNQDRFDEIERTVRFEAGDLGFFSGLAQPLNVLVLAEDWCGDVIANLPVLGRLAQESGKLNLRIFLRDQNLDLMEQYLKHGQFRSIPVFVFFDSEFREIGHWIERPAKMTELLDEVRKKQFASDPELVGLPISTPPSELPEQARIRLGQAFTAFRAETRDFSEREVVREIRDLVAGVRASVASNGAPRTATPMPLRQQPARQPSDHPVKVTITYCAHCGYETQTLALAQALMVEFHDDIAALELIPWHDGTFDVSVDGELVHSMALNGGFPEHEAIIGAVRERAASMQTS